MFASGTGTTAYFVAKYFASRRDCVTVEGNLSDVEVIAIPCVSTSAHLLQQMKQLQSMCEHANTLSGDDVHVFPTIMSSNVTKKRVFAKPYKEHFHIWKELHLQSGIEFDLIYAPRAFEIMLVHANPPAANNKQYSLEISLTKWVPGTNIVYYHCGGVEGNESQLARYQRDNIT